MKNKQILEHISKSDLASETKAIGMLGVLLDAKPDSIIKGMMGAQSAHDTRIAEKQTKPRKPRGLTKTESILFDMLHESTGTAMCDSGGDMGRHWQRNRMIKDFRKSPEIIVDGSYHSDQPEITIDIFHFINNKAEYDELMTREFKKFCKKDKELDIWHYGAAEEFAEHMHQGNEKPLSGNSYNGECLLSQTIQFACFEFNDESYTILQIHQGADVRGGYTDAVIFKTFDSYDLISYTNCNARCSCGDFYTDDGYHWYDSSPFEGKDHSYNWSTRKKAYYCRECHDEVSFS